MRRRCFVFVLTCPLGVLAACSRYEYRALDCRPQPAERGRLSWSVSRQPRLVGGTVRLDGSALSPATATARLEALDSAPGSPREEGIRARVAAVDSAGHFRFEGVPPGRYRLRVMRIGFVGATDTITVRAGAGVAAEAALRPSTTGFDECDRIRVRTRKPWYRWW